MKRRDPEPLSAILERAFAQSGNSDVALSAQVSAAWVEVVGPGINRMTTRRWVDRDVLHVTIASAPLRQELSFGRQELVRALNERVGREAITDIRFH